MLEKDYCAMDTQRTGGRHGNNDLDQHLEHVLGVLADLIQGGALSRCVLDFDADHVGLMNRTEHGRMRFFSVHNLLGQTRFALAGREHRQAAETCDLPCALADVADLRRQRRQPLHQASLDIDRGWATLRFADGHIRTTALDCLRTNGNPAHQLAS